MRKQILFSLAAAAALAALGCSNPASPGGTVQTPSVNVAGFFQNDSNQNYPCLWNDGTGTELTETALGNNDATSVFVSDGTAFVAGSVSGDDGYAVACYWTCLLNQEAGSGVTAQRVDLPDGGDRGAQALSVFVDGDMVYLAGYESDASSVMRACYWTHEIGAEDAVQYYLTDGDLHAQASAVFVRNGAVYMSGYTTNASGDKVACYWTDSSVGAVSMIVSDYDSEAYSVFVDGSGTIYTAGYRSTGDTDNDTIACYWVGPGDRCVDLSAAESDANGILVDDGVVYVCGSDYVTADSLLRACYWTDSAAVDADDPERVLMDSGSTMSYASSLFLTDLKIYVAGCYISGGGNSIAAYWTDSRSEDATAPARVPLSDGSTDAMAWSVSVGYVADALDS